MPVRADVTPVLACPSCESRFLRAPAGAPTRSGGQDDEEVPDDLLLTKEFVERYDVQRLLGAGGAGRVYLAKDRRAGVLVAIKFMLALADPSVIKRFHREGQLLAAVNNPHVVRLVELGQLPGGAPYLVSELVPGGTLRALIKNGPVEMREALRLTLDLLKGLTALHKAGVIHRDIKPDNILLDSSGRAKIADLGLARQEKAGGTKLTVTGAVLGTPRYMSPEQARGEVSTTASDIYAAGVVLFELLTGKTPFKASNYFELMRAHVETTPEPLRAMVPGAPAELEAIVAQSLEKNAANRPLSAADMAGVIADCKRQLDARARTRSLAVVGSILLCVWLAVSVARTRMWPDYKKQGIERLANGQAAEALVPLEKCRAEALAAQGPHGAEVADLATLIGRAHLQLGHVVEARTSFRAALEGRRRSFGFDGVPVSETFADLGLLERSLGRLAAALLMMEGTLAIRSQRLGPDHPLVADAECNLGKVLVQAGDPGRGEKLLRHALVTWEKAGSGGELTAGNCLNVIGWLETEQQRYAAALETYKRAMAIFSKKLPADHPDQSAVLSNVADVYVRMRDSSSALALYEQALAILDRAGQRQRPLAASLLINTGNAYLTMDQAAAAAPLLEEAVGTLRKLYGNDHPNIAVGLFNLGKCYVSQKLGDKAEAVLVEALSIQERLLPETHPKRLQTLSCLAFARVVAGRTAQAEPLTRALTSLTGTGFNTSHGEFIATLDDLATQYESRGLLPPALALQERAEVLSAQVFGPSDERTALAGSHRARTLERAGRKVEAETQWRTVLERWRSAGRPVDSPLVPALKRLVELVRAAGRADEAVKLAAELGGTGKR